VTNRRGGKFDPIVWAVALVIVIVFSAVSYRVVTLCEPSSFELLNKLKVSLGGCQSAKDVQLLATDDAQLTPYVTMLLDADRNKALAAIAYFGSTPSIKEKAIPRLARMLLNSEDSGVCAPLEALTRLAPERPLKDGMLVRDVTKTLIPIIDYNKIPLGGIEIRKANCPRIHLERASISQLSLRNANLRDAEFSYVDVAGTSFQNADLRGAYFRQGTQWVSDEAGSATDMSDADLRGALFEQELSKVVLNDAKLDGALFTWVTGVELRKLPGRYFSSAVCMAPVAAKACHDWHLARTRSNLTNSSAPSGCPTNIKGPIILVYGHGPERAECSAWVANAQQNAPRDGPKAARP